MKTNVDTADAVSTLSLCGSIYDYESKRISFFASHRYHESIDII